MYFLELSKIKSLEDRISISVKRIKLTLLFVLLGVLTLVSQNKSTSLKLTQANVMTMAKTGYVRCATVESEKKLSEKNSDSKKEVVFESWMSAKMAQRKRSRINGKLSTEVYNIPVVVHVVSNGDRVNTIGNVIGENISDAQVESQIAVLNQDYRRTEGTLGGRNSTGLAVDVEVNFILANKDPNGLNTKGIIRHNIDPYTNNVTDDSDGGDWETYEDVQKMKIATQWDPTKYLNIWVLRMGGEKIDDDGLKNLLGYAQLPSSSGLVGLDDDEGRSNTDGVVIAFHVFGTSEKNDGSFYLTSPYNRGRTTTHEVGHFLGLRHTWGDCESIDSCTNGCDVDDYCEDTPDTKEPNTECNLSTDSCPLEEGRDMVQNYMEYTEDECMDTFTQDQKNRIITVLNNSPRRVELLTSTVANSPIIDDFTVKPNPALNNVNIVGSANGKVKLLLFDAYGRVVKKEEFLDIDTTFSGQLNISQLAPGIYILLIENENRKIVRKVVKR